MDAFPVAHADTARTERPVRDGDPSQLGLTLGRIAAAAAALVSLVELFVWIVRPAWILPTSRVYLMKANAALAILALAVAVLLESMPPLRRRTVAVRALAALALMVATVTIVEYATGWSSGLDGWPGPDPTADAGRMALQSALVLSLCGLAVLTVHSRTGRTRWLCDGSLLVSAAILEVMATGYFNHAVRLYDASGRMTAAPQSAAAQMALCASIVFVRLGTGAYRLVIGTRAASMALRVLMPLVVFMPIVMGRLRLLGETRGWFAQGYGDALLSVLQTAVLGAVVYALARWIDRFERQYRVERQRREEYERYVAMCAWTRRIQWEGTWISVEEFLERRFGLTVSHGISEEALAEQLAVLEHLQNDSDARS